MKLTIIFVLLASFSLLAQERASIEREGGGGTVIAAYFPMYGEFALEMLSRGITEITSEKIDRVISETEVFDVRSICFYETNSRKNIICRDAEYDGVNKRIKFDRNKWNAMNCRKRLVITAHEYLRAMGLERADYKYSSKLVSGRLYDFSDLGDSDEDNAEYLRRKRKNAIFRDMITYQCDEFNKVK